MPSLILRLFGTPRIELNGSPVATDRRKALALLIYLAVNGMDYSRETLSTLLWPDQDTSHALAYLRRTLWEINQTFGPGWVHTEKDIVGLHPDARAQMWIDVSRFRTLMAKSREPGSHADAVPLLDEAAALYKDDFLSGFILKDTSLFETWVSSQSEALKRDFHYALETLSQAYARQGDLEKAISTASAWVTHDNLNESAHCLLMSLLARNGQFSAAFRQYQECAHTLARELDVQPSVETRNLFEQIKKSAEQKAAGPFQEIKPTVWQDNALLTAYTTSFFGRRNELAELEKLLHNPQVHLVTILGPGGAGKTRLAIEAGRINSLAFADGACFVPLAAVNQPEYVISAIANALGIHFVASENRPPLVQLSEILANRHLLLILDNLEHLQAGTSTVTELVEALLKAAPRLTVLATSHERLNLQQEWVVHIQGMRVPPAEAPDWDQYGSVQLFVQNARKSAGQLRLTEADRRAISRICLLVGGLPLGLELAAAWTKMLSCEEIAREIEHGLDFLKTPLKNVVARHQSLRATFEYSWNFLSEAEQSVLMKLAVFRGGFQREAALAVANASLPVLAELSDKSLLHRSESGRFDIHQALKPFILEKRAASRTVQTESDRNHALFFAAFTRQHMLLLRGPGQQFTLEEMTLELENILLGWQWAISQGDETDVQAYLEGLFRYFDLRNRFHDAENLFSRAVDIWQTRCGSENATCGLLLACHSWFCNRISRIIQAHQLLMASLTLLRRLNARPQLMFANSLALYVVPMMGDMEEVERIAQETFAFYQEQNDRWGMAQTLPFFHRMKTPQRLDEAIRLHHETLQIFRETGDAAGTAATLASLGELYHYAGDLTAALQHHQASLDIVQGLNDRRAIAASLDYLGYIHRQMGEFDLARQQHQQSLEISRELDDPLGIAGSIDNLGLIALDQQAYPEALLLFKQALPIRRQAGQRGAIAISLEHMAAAALKLNDLSLTQDCLEEALILLDRDPEWALSSHAINRLGDLELARGNPLQAEFHFRMSLDQAVQHQSSNVALDAVMGLSAAAAAQGNPQRAVRLAAFVNEHPACEYALHQQAQKRLSEWKACLPLQSFSDALADGKLIGLDEILKSCSPKELST